MGLAGHSSGNGGGLANSRDVSVLWSVDSTSPFLTTPEFVAMKCLVDKSELILDSYQWLCMQE